MSLALHFNTENKNKRLHIYILTCFQYYFNMSILMLSASSCSVLETAVYFQKSNTMFVRLFVRLPLLLNSSVYVKERLKSVNISQFLVSMNLDFTLL